MILFPFLPPGILLCGANRIRRFHFPKNKKPAQNNSVAGFTTRSLIPVVTTLGYQFIASTND
jgi:hypothetical protein